LVKARVRDEEISQKRSGPIEDEVLNRNRMSLNHQWDPPLTPTHSAIMRLGVQLPPLLWSHSFTFYPIC